MTSTRPVSSTPGTAKTSTAPGSARPESEAAAPTRPAEVLEHRARAQPGILRVIGVGAGRAGVHGGRGEPAYLVEQVCFGVVGQVMGVGQGEVGGAPDHAGAPELR